VSARSSARSVRRTGALLVACALAAPGLVVAKPAKHASRPIAAARKPAPAKGAAKERAPRATAAEAATPSAAGDDDKGASEAVTTTADGTRVKSKSYSFGAMDVEGKLKTPQLLYFLNRVKLELDMSAPDKRSFMKELGQSADDKNL
jgi:hypothetical protein